MADRAARRRAARSHARRPAHADVLVGCLAPHERLVHMDTRALKRWGLRALILLAVAAGLWALLLLAHSAENSADFNRRQPWILLLNSGAVIALGVLLARKLWQLYRDFQGHVPGSRLTVRTVVIFGSLVVVPLLVVYLFALEFLNYGIDSWFRGGTAPHRHRRAAGPRDQCPRRALCAHRLRSARGALGSRRRGPGRLLELRRSVGQPPAAEDQFHADPDARTAHHHAGGGVRRGLVGAASDPAGEGSDCRHPRGGQG